MRSNFRHLIALATLACLAGCDIAEKIPLTPQEALKAANTFGMPTREKIEETPAGTIYRLSVEANWPANWLEADRAMWSHLHHTCPQGELHETLSTEPAENRHTDERFAPQAAGTLFVRTVRCAPRLPFEFDVDPGTTADAAFTDMYHWLGSQEQTETSEPMLSAIHPDKYSPKYQQVREAIGRTIYARLARCPQGVAVRNLRLGVMPAGSATSEGVPRRALLGFHTECVVPATAGPDAATAGG